MSDYTHKVLRDLEAEFGWTRGGSFSVRTTIDGRVVLFVCPGSEPFWECGVSWSKGFPKRKRKQAEKRAAEVLSLALDPTAKRVLESVPHPSNVPVEDGFHMWNPNLVYRAAGEPPPAKPADPCSP